jgi:hypothetical protein
MYFKYSYSEFIIYFNVFQCISMYLNVFNYIIIEISLSHFHYNDLAMNTHLHIFFFTIYNDSLSEMLYHYTLFSRSHWFIPTFIQSLKILHTSYYFSPLYIIPQSIFHVVIGCVEHSGAQPIFLIFYWSLFYFKN